MREKPQATAGLLWAPTCCPCCLINLPPTSERESSTEFAVSRQNQYICWAAWTAKPQRGAPLWALLTVALEDPAGPAGLLRGCAGPTKPTSGFSSCCRLPPRIPSQHSQASQHSCVADPIQSHTPQTLNGTCSS